MVLWGSLVNAIAIIAGALLGVAVRFPERIRQTIMQALALAVMIIGISMGTTSSNILLPIIALVIGSVIEELLKIETRLAGFGQIMQQYSKRNNGNKDDHTFTQGFITATLVYCVGAMAVIGGLNSGLHGDHQVLYTKSMLDGISAIFFTTSFGLGVAFSAIPVFLYQGIISLFAAVLAPALSAHVLQEITATGGILILGIGLNMLGITKIAVGNMLPAILVAALLAVYF